jgi:hypothetical protein
MEGHTMTTVDDHAALVLIDLQQGILDLPVLTAPRADPGSEHPPR